MLSSALRYILVITLFLASAPAEAQWLKKIPSSDNLYREARQETDLKNYKRAKYLAQQAREISPRNLDIRVLIGRLHMLTNDLDSARAELDYVIEKNPKYRDAYVYLANIEISTGNYAQALAYTETELSAYPFDKEFMLKKFEILNKMGNRIESNKIAEQLLYVYPDDKKVLFVYIDQRLTLGREYAKRGYFDRAKEEFQAVLDRDPTNKEALDAIFNLDVRSGNYESSLAYINWALQTNPRSYEYLLKKAGILQEMLRYADAITVSQQLLKYYPSDRKAQELNVNLRMEAGRFYMNTDPYLQFQGVLEKQPSNREALDYVINLSYSRGLYHEALDWVNQALKYNSGDITLINKKIGILENLQRYGSAAELAEFIWKKYPTKDNKDHFVDFKNHEGKQYLSDLQYEAALKSFKTVLFIDPANESALNYATSIYSEQKNYDEGLRLIDDAIRYYPEDDNLLFKKAAILENYGKFDEAAAITRDLSDKYPNNRTYLLSYIEQALASGRQSMQYQDFSGAITRLKDVLDKQPGNKDALNYIINLESGIKNYDSALQYVDLALYYYPDSKEYLLKKSAILSDNKQYKDAYAISKALYEQYPYNGTYKQAYVDQLLASGRTYNVDNKPDSALAEFQKALEVSPSDTSALFYSINLLNDTKQYDSAIVLIARGRKMYPFHNYFPLKSAVVYESMLKYDSAFYAIDTFNKMTPNDTKYKDYANYLYSKTLKNELGIFLLRSTFDDESRQPWHIATMQYIRYHKRGSIIGRLNYAGRINGTGYQGELETYFNHTKKTYSYAVVGLSNSVVFPKLRLGYSLYHNFKKGYEGEIGIRYLSAEDSFRSVSGVASIAKGVNDFWINLRGYVINFDQKTYGAAQLTARYYITGNKNDFVSAIAGYGTAPDDRSRNFNLSNQVIFNTITVGAGIQKSIKYRTIVLLNASWINQRLTETVFQNQYDINLGVRHFF